MDKNVKHEMFEEIQRLMKSKRYEQALRELRMIDDEPSENCELSYFLGICYAKLEDYDNALLYLEQTVGIHWNLLLIYQCRMILSYIYSVTRRFQLAAYELEQLMDSGYESVQVYATYGYVLYSQGKTDEALDHLQKALLIDPDNSNAMNSLGYIMAEKDMDNPSAVNYCRAALKTSPQNPAYLDSLGWAFFKGGRLDEAKQYLREALNLSRGNPTIAGHMQKVLEAEEGDPP